MSSLQSNPPSDDYSDFLVAGDSHPTMENPEVVEALEEYRTSTEDKAVVRARLLRRHPDVTTELTACLDVIDILENAVTKRSSSTAEGSLLPRALGDFHLLREIGRGGMGIVYEAVQFSLGRRVAVKILPHAYALEPTWLRRFENEARTTALLRHPGIVPVLLVGIQDGVHYSVMELIDGQSLAEVLRARRSGATSAELLTCSAAMDRLYPGGRVDCRAVARLGAQAAAALAHAHQSGVIHRDIKPANLLLDSHQNLLITDFGLAHVIDASRLTHTGDFLGTLRYTSPEQTRAAQVVVDHRTDIYSLGVTLYEMLTGHPPFTATDHRELLRQITFDEPKPLRQLDRSIPVEVQTIVLKAMAKDRDERYATAQDLADDLQRFVDEKPIRAQTASVLQRVRRWVHRHQTLVWSSATASLLLLVSAVVILGVTNHRVRQERERAEQQRIKAEQAREQAGAALRLTQQVIRGMLVRLSEERLSLIPQLDLVRREILFEALACSERLQAIDTEDPAFRWEVALVRAQIGLIQYKTGEKAQAEKSLRESIAMIEALTESDPMLTEAKDKLFWLYTTLGWHLGTEPGREQEVISIRRKALDFAQQLNASQASTAKHRNALSSAWTDLGNAYRKSRPQEALECYRQAINVASKEGPITHGVGRASLALGEMYASRCEWVKSEESLRRSLSVHGALSKKYPDYWQFRERLADAFTILAQVQTATGNPLAGSHARRAVEIYQKLHTDFPSRPDYSTGLARAYAALLPALGSREEPLEENSAALHRRILKLVPHRSEVAAELAWALANCAEPKWCDYAHALKLAQSALKTVPTSATALRALGAAQLRSGAVKEALASLKQSQGFGNGDAAVGFLLAETYALLGEQDLARRTFDQADRLMKERRPNDSHLRHLQRQSRAKVFSH